MPSGPRVAAAPGRQQSVAIAVRDRNRSALSQDQPFSTTRARHPEGPNQNHSRSAVSSPDATGRAVSVSRWAATSRSALRYSPVARSHSSSARSCAGSAFADGLVDEELPLVAVAGGRGELPQQLPRVAHGEQARHGLLVAGRRHALVDDPVEDVALAADAREDRLRETPAAAAMSATVTRP